MEDTRLVVSIELVESIHPLPSLTLTKNIGSQAWCDWILIACLWLGDEDDMRNEEASICFSNLRIVVF